MFRHQRGGDFPKFHIIIVHSDGFWYHYLRGEGDGESDLLIDSDYSSRISTALNDGNHLRIIANGSEGWFFINGEYVSKLDLSGLSGSGNIYSVASYFQDDGIYGKIDAIRGFHDPKIVQGVRPSRREYRT